MDALYLSRMPYFVYSGYFAAAPFLRHTYDELLFTLTMVNQMISKNNLEH